MIRKTQKLRHVYEAAFFSPAPLECARALVVRMLASACAWVRGEHAYSIRDAKKHTVMIGHYPSLSSESLVRMMRVHIWHGGPGPRQRGLLGRPLMKSWVRRNQRAEKLVTLGGGEEGINSFAGRKCLHVNLELHLLLYIIKKNPASFELHAMKIILHSIVLSV